MKTENILALAAGAAAGYVLLKPDNQSAGVGKSKSFNALVKKVESLTDVNNHTGSILAIAEYYELKKYADLLKGIFHLQNIEGFMPYELGQYRHQVYKQIMDWLKNNLPEDEYEALNAAL